MEQLVGMYQIHRRLSVSMEPLAINPCLQAIDKGFPKTKYTRRITHLSCSNSIRGGLSTVVLTKKVTTFPWLREAKPSEKRKEKRKKE